MGPVLGLTLRAEIGAITRFPDGPHLASFAGLVPRVDSSANHTWYGRITRKGSPWIRWALVEVAMHAMKRDDLTGRRACSQVVGHTSSLDVCLDSRGPS
jgi:transposase